ncbi:MAG TPA: hypothetical protein VET48_14505 [Steroidobacteraceae bacterium]|nr:hypothetical protein [Steroidobacteraceae bacterium]
MGEKPQGGSPYSNQTGLSWLLPGRVLEKQQQHDNALLAFKSAIAHLSHTVDAIHPALQEAQRLLRPLDAETS